MALSVQNLSSGYGRLQVLFGISLEVLDKSVISLLGPNGAGKSTTLWTVMGVVRPWEGRILLGGTDVTKVPPHKKVELGLALVPEGRRLFPEMTVEENLLMGAFTKRARDKMQDTLEFVYALFPRLKERIHKLQGVLHLIPGPLREGTHQQVLLHGHLGE